MTETEILHRKIFVLQFLFGCTAFLAVGAIVVASLAMVHSQHSRDALNQLLVEFKTPPVTGL